MGLKMQWHLGGKRGKQQPPEDTIHCRTPQYVQIIFFLFLLPKKKPQCFLWENVLVIMQWYILHNCIFQVKYSSLKRFGRSSPFSLICWYVPLEKHLLSAGKTSAHLVFQVRNPPVGSDWSAPALYSQPDVPQGARGVPTTAGDPEAPAWKLLCLSQWPQLQEHCCLLRPWKVPQPAVLRWTLPNGLEEDCWQQGDTNLGQLTTKSCLHTPWIGPIVLPLTLSSFLWLWVMSVSNPSYSNISFPYFSSSREDSPPSLLIVRFVF